MSNLVDDLMRPLFSEYVVSPVSARGKQWQRVVSAGCSGRLCERIFKTAEQASAYLSKFIPKG